MAGEGFDARHDDCPDGLRGEAAGWMLGALDPVQARNFAAHLLGCRACRLTVDELQVAARALLDSSSLQPPEHLAAATLARVRRTASRA
jgi:Putative zinc-finger